jgi:UDP-GlcNAc:undecaprenyl-phosphate/decaprenyl-phosphate GlcNAc-1-phosphate transferase
MILSLPFWIALVLSLILVPLVRNISIRFGLVELPKADRWHTKPTPKVGGIAIFISFAVALSITTFISFPVDFPWALLAGALITFSLGVLDDSKHLSPGAKLIGQILAASIVVFFGRNLEFFDLEILNVLFTFVWLIGITNAINLLDNMDGLAGGVALIAALMLSLMFWQVQAFSLLTIALALGGGIFGFLVFNFPPASIFMGDGGSLFLGFTLASLAIAQVPRASNLLAILGVPTLIFLLPILDTTMVTITRILRGQSPAQGGKDHTSHRLIAFGLSERQTVLALYGVALLSGILGSFLESIDYNISILLIPVLLLVFTLLTAYLARIKVVKTPETQPQGSITRLMIGLTGRGRVLEIALDLVIISLSYYLAFWLYFGNGINILSMELFLQSLPLVIAGSYLVFFILGIYRRIWQYVGVKDLLRFLWAALGSGILLMLIQNFIFSQDRIPLSIAFLFGVFLFLGLAASRASFRLLDQLYSQQIKGTEDQLSVLIFGADDIGVLTLQWLLHNPALNYQAIGFLDNDPFKRGRQIQDIDVLGSAEELESILAKHKFQGIILPSNESINNFQHSEAIKICERHGIWFKRLKINFESIDE